MALGSVTVNQVNKNQGEFKQVEKTFLFVIAGTTAAPIAVNMTTDLSAAPFNDHPALLAARDNARDENWFAYVMPVSSAATVADELATVETAFDHPHNLDVESIVFLQRSFTGADVAALSSFINTVNNTHGRNITVMITANVDNDTDTWATALPATTGPFESIVEKRVSVVPNFGAAEDMTLAGIIAGRLCAVNTTIADSPMRVATGPIIGDWPTAVDSAGAPFTMAHVRQLAEKRFSVPQTYPGYPGVYWADHPTLDTETGDYQVIEYQRVMDYVARRVRLLAIARIADRRLNSTAASIESNKTYLARPLREAARSVVVAGEEMPGLIHPPEGDAITITWTSKTAVSISITAQPFNCPKQITLNLSLDLSA